MPNYESLLAEAAQLPVAERIQLVEALWETLPSDALPPLDEEWQAEIARRSAELDAGTVTALPWEEIRDAALERLRGRRD